MRRGLVVVLCLLGTAGLGGRAGQKTDPVPKELAARTVELTGQVTLGEALAKLAQATGSSVVDRRRQKSNPTLTFEPTKSTFWPALDLIATKAGAGLSLYQADGTVALVDGPYRKQTVSYSGLFRTALKRVTVSRDEGPDAHSCVVNLEVAWEPRFQPLFLQIGPTSITFSKDANGKSLKADLPAGGKVSVSGKAAVEVELRTAAPDRSAAKIESLQGTFSVVGPAKMHVFRFDKLTPIPKGGKDIKQKQDDVTVSLTRLVTQSGRWTVDVLIEKPAGGPKFESFQSWLDNNRIYLEKGKGKDRVILASSGEAELAPTTETRAAVQYHFEEREGGPRLGKLSDWTLVYHTAGRIVEVPARFAFKDLTLP
jgi:hypothetical protein